MMKKAFFLPLLLIVCLLAPVPAVHSISLAGNALKVIPPIPDFSASNPVPFGRPDDDFESRYRMVRFFQPHQPVHFVQQIAGRNAKPPSKTDDHPGLWLSFGIFEFIQVFLCNTRIFCKLVLRDVKRLPDFDKSRPEETSIQTSHFFLLPGMGVLVYRFNWTGIFMGTEVCSG